MTRRKGKCIPNPEPCNFISARILCVLSELQDGISDSDIYEKYFDDDSRERVSSRYASRYSIGGYRVYRRIDAMKEQGLIKVNSINNYLNITQKGRDALKNYLKE